jgi:ATP-dependent DNA helicase RecQ
MNCDPTYITTDALPKDAIVHANNFINGEVITIEPRKRWPYEIQKSHTIPKELQFNRGRTLCIYGDAGYGKMIAEDKYKYGFIRKELLLASASLINNWDELPKDNICICYIPSNNRPNFVKDFAYGLSSILNIPIVDVFQKIDTGLSQKSFQNSPKQYDNAISSISVKKGCVIPDNVLLIDDIVDSRWTLVAATVKLNEIRVHNIYPFTVANSNGKVENSDV